LDSYLLQRKAQLGILGLSNHSHACHRRPTGPDRRTFGRFAAARFESLRRRIVALAQRGASPA